MEHSRSRSKSFVRSESLRKIILVPRSSMHKTPLLLPDELKQLSDLEIIQNPQISLDEKLELKYKYSETIFKYRLN